MASFIASITWGVLSWSKASICGTLWNKMQGCLPLVLVCLMPVYFIQMFWHFLKWNCACDFNLTLKLVCCCSCIFRVFPDLTFVHWQHEVGRLWCLEDNLRCFSPHSSKFSICSSGLLMGWSLLIEQSFSEKVVPAPDKLGYLLLAPAELISIDWTAISE